jgi:hypothetical protein
MYVLTHLFRRWNRLRFGSIRRVYRDHEQTRREHDNNKNSREIIYPVTSEREDQSINQASRPGGIGCKTRKCYAYRLVCWLIA